jgi:hypothetical protein
MATKNTKPTKPPGETTAPSPPTETSAIAQPDKAPPKPRNTKVTLEQRAALPSVDPDASPARTMQEQSIAPPTPERLSVTLRTEQSYEYNLDLPREVVEKFLDPNVADCFIEVPGVSYGGQRLHGVRRFLHTSYIKEIDVKGL